MSFKYPPQGASDLVGVVRMQMIPFLLDGGASFSNPGLTGLPASVVTFPSGQNSGIKMFTARLPLGYKPTTGKIRIRFRTDAPPAPGKQVRFVVAGGIIVSGGATSSSATISTVTNVDLDTYDANVAAAEAEFSKDFIDTDAVNNVKAALATIGQGSDVGTFFAAVQRNGVDEGDSYPGDVFIASVCVDLDTGPF